MTTKRDLLKKEIEQRLIPTLVGRGFRSHPLFEEERAGEIARAFPFGRLKRKKGDGLQLVEIQMDKYGSAKFVFNFGTAPPEGLSLPTGRFRQDELGVSDLPEAYRLYDTRFGMRWFSLPLFFPLGAGSKVSKTVDRALRLLPEMEAWFDSGAVGPHMRWFGHDWNKIVQGKPNRPGRAK